MSDLLTVVLPVGLAAVTAAVGWLVARVLKEREDAIELRARVAAIESKAANLESTALTQESVRKVVEQALSSRDVVAEDRRKAWDETLTLKIKAAVADGFAECQRQTRSELERILANRPRTARSTDRARARGQGGKS